MAIVNVNEGHHGTAAAADDLVFPNITSCLTFTLVMADDSRHGAHMVFAPAGGQDDAPTLAAWLGGHANPAPTAIYMMGEIGTWNTSLEKAPKGTFDSAGKVAQAVSEATGCDNVEFIDTAQYAVGNHSIEIRFLAAGKALQVVDHTGAVKHAATW